MSTFTSKEQLLQHIKSLQLAPAEEKLLTDEINAASDFSPELLDRVKDLLQKIIDDTFDAAGVTLDENDPEYQAEFQKMTQAIDKAQNDFAEEADKLQKEADEVTKTTSKKFDDLQIQSVQNQINAQS